MFAQKSRWLLAALAAAAIWTAGCASPNNGGSLLSPSATNGKPEAAANAGNQEKETLMKEIAEGDFVYRLYAERERYKEGEQPAFKAELEYVGLESSVTIAHAASPFWFSILESSDRYQFVFAMDQPLIRTTLKRGEPFRETYGFAHAQVKENEDDLFGPPADVPFPEGVYLIGGAADFTQLSSPEDDSGERIKFGIQPKEGLTITVTP